MSEAEEKARAYSGIDNISTQNPENRELWIAAVAKMHGYLAGYAAAKSKWISVGERLPECAGRYMVLIGNGVEFAFYDAVSWDFHDHCVPVYRGATAIVTHWAELPAAPEVEK